MTPKVLFGQLGGWQCHPLTEETPREGQFHSQMRKLKTDRQSDKEASVLKGPKFCWHITKEDQVMKDSFP